MIKTKLSNTQLLEHVKIVFAVTDSGRAMGLDDIVSIHTTKAGAEQAAEAARAAGSKDVVITEANLYDEIGLAKAEADAASGALSGA
jgi:hypothetical protein